MANLPESPNWTDGVYQIERNDPVGGGPDGAANKPLKDLTNRTRWLYEKFGTAFDNLGWMQLGVWAIGLEVSLPTQIVSFDGSWYRYRGNLDAPHIIAGASPTDDGGVWSGDEPDGVWVDVGDASIRADLISSDGDQMLGTSGGLTQRERNTVVRDIRDHGGVDDWNGSTGTNNFSAFVAATATRPCRVYLPYTNTGVYYIDGSSSLSDVEGVEYISEPGVEIHTPSDSISNIIRKPGSKSNRHLPIGVGGTSAFMHGISDGMFNRPSEKTFIGSELSGECFVPGRLRFNAFHAPIYVHTSGAWPDMSLNFSSDGIAVSSDEYLTVDSPLESQYIGTMFPVVPGDSIRGSCRPVTGNANYGDSDTGVIVEIDTGFVIATMQPAGTALTVRERSAYGDQILTSVDLNKLNIKPYKFQFSMLGVIVYDANRFGIIVNETVVYTYQTKRGIISAGLVRGYSTAASKYNIGFLSRIVGKRSFAVPYIDVVCIGDSTADRDVAVESQFEFAAQYLSGISGCQINKLTNLAVRGQASSQQKAILLATDITGYDLCLIQIGINDIQGGTGAATLATNVLAMITYCRTNGVEPIVSIPAMFYTRADIIDSGVDAHGHIGQASGNSANGSEYRLRLMQMLSDQNVFYNSMTTSAFGMVTPELLGMGDRVDPVVMDNIHPSIFGSKLLGMAWARTITAYYLRLTDSLRRGVTVAPAALSGALRIPKRYFTGNAGVISTPFYSVSGSQLSLSYYLSRGGESWDNATPVGVLPLRLRPMFEQTFYSVPCHTVSGVIVPVSGATPVLVVIATNGNIYIRGITSSADYIPFSIAYSI
ncbi:hypothetical protein IG611_15240 [Pectobacterium sp. A535-S3-A17]|uniref:SGNH/GDSL hydrolase family protein n=1 Tax=Pectobacterium quasiaquaticum TaxID=2774015 RepID=UPI0018762858|nr:hypothetical protein [Pectobacterium quasiaquaticum]MBE5226698.1 hypothetical protein [Pectobacterium quasiaquaticum]